MITKERAEEIRTKCRELEHSNPKTRKSGSWADQLENVISPEEDKEIQDLLQTMPGNTAYVHAFYRLLNGTAYEGL